MNSRNRNASRTFFGTATVMALGFSVCFVLQSNWLATAIMALYLAVSIIFALWANQYLTQARVTPQRNDTDPEEITKSELAGYIGMAALYVAALFGTAITGDWIWAAMAVASVFVGFWLVARVLKRGEVLSLKRIVDSFF